MNKMLKDKGMSQDDVLKRFTAIAKMKKNMSDFEKEYKIFQSHSIPTEEALIKLKDETEKKLEKIYKNYERADEMDKKCNSIIENMEEMKGKLEEIVKFQDCIGSFLVNYNKHFRETIVVKK